MAAALSPELAVAYVRELSADVRAAVVLAANGAVLAGDPDLAPAALAFARALGAAADGAVRTERGLVVAARTPQHTLLVVTTALALESTTRLDAIAAAAALSGVPEAAPSHAAAPTPALIAAADAAISAADTA